MPAFSRTAAVITFILTALVSSPSFAQSNAGTIPLNGSASGYLDGSSTESWWKVTVPSDGRLAVNTHASTGDPQLTIMLWMYDQSGSHQIADYNGGWGVDTSVNYDNLMPGTYYIRAYRWTGAGSYTISSTFTASVLTVEPEPNDSAQVALTIPLNGSDTGHLGFYSDGFTDTVDWWKITIPLDGKLMISTDVDASDPQLEIMLWIYDQGGSHQIADYNGGWGNHTTVNYDNLKPGTYYIRAYKWTGYGSYTISSSFTPSTLTVEQESNDSTAVALDIPLNGSITAHLGFYSDGVTDTVDWWKVTIPQDGRLVISTDVDASDPQLEIMLWMYDQGGSHQITSYNSGWGNHTTVNYDNLMPGTYYIRADRWTGYGSYTVSSAFTPSTLAVEEESNDSTLVALDLDLNGSTTAHLGFYSDEFTDSVDWWKVTIPQDGKLLITTESAQPDSILQIMLYLYDMQGTHEINSYNAGWGVYTTVNRDNLMPGTYYIKAYKWTGYGSYTISSSFTPSTLEVEPEPNDSAMVAVTLDPNGTDSAHLGFYADNYTDTTDWWNITVPGDGRLVVTSESAQPDSILTIMLYLYDTQGTRQIKGYNAGWGTVTTVNYDNLKAGTYHVKASRWTEFGSYHISSSFYPVHYANDAEPNNTRETGQSVSLQTTVTGHLSYFGEDGQDTADFFSFTVPSGWDSLFVRVKTDSTLTPILHLLNSEGDQITSGWGPTIAIANPASGAYSFYLSHWSGYGAYAFVISNTRPSDVPVSATDPIDPPSRLIVSDVPDDNGHQLLLSWTISPSEGTGDVLKYRIFRSRSGTATDPAPLSQFTTMEALNEWEVAHTVLVDSVSAGVSQYTDFVPLDETPYYYWVQAVGIEGVSRMAAWAPDITTAAEEIPLVFRVSAPYPNPFNPSVTIRYEIPERTRVRLTVFDSLGRTVALLVDEMMNPGAHETVWNGKSSRGETLGSGMYLYRIEAGNKIARGKMTLLR